jgi:O-antigen/teichoic acid export membrane protein
MLLPVVLAPREVTHLLYGKKWDLIIPLLPVLAVQGCVRGILRIMAPFFWGMDRTGSDLQAKVLETAVFIPGSIIGVQHYGAIGGAWAGTVSYSLALLMRSWMMWNMFRRPKQQAPGAAAVSSVES